MHGRSGVRQTFSFQSITNQPCGDGTVKLNWAEDLASLLPVTPLSAEHQHCVVMVRPTPHSSSTDTRNTLPLIVLVVELTSLAAPTASARQLELQVMVGKGTPYATQGEAQSLQVLQMHVHG